MSHFFLGFADELCKLAGNGLKPIKPVKPIPAKPAPVKAPEPEMTTKELTGKAAEKHLKSLPKQGPVKSQLDMDREESNAAYKRSKAIKEQENETY